MSTVNGLEARVLVYDPEYGITEQVVHHLEERFGKGTVDVEGSGKPVELSTINYIDDLVTRVLNHDPVYYSLVVYPVSIFKESGSMGSVARIHKYDPFMPQMVLGDYRAELTDAIITDVFISLESFDNEMSAEHLKLLIDTWVKAAVNEHVVDTTVLGKSERAGILYSAANDEQLKAAIHGMIFKQLHPLPNLVVVKIGGSALDFTIQNTLEANLGIVCSELSQLHAQRLCYEEVYIPPYSQTKTWKDSDGHVHKDVIHKPGRRVRREVTRVQRILITVGAGPAGDFYKTLFKVYSRSHPRLPEEFPLLIAHVLENNLQAVSCLFNPVFKPDKSTSYGKPELLTSGAYYRINETQTSQAIPLIPTAPHWIMVKQGIPLTDSDTQTLALADLYGAERVILLKRTDGIYNFDPYRGFKPDYKPPYGCADLNAWRSAQRHNRRHAVVNVNGIINNEILREGTGITGLADGTRDHLMETSALEYFRDRCTRLKEIVVVHVAPHELYHQSNYDGFSHVITREQLQLSRGGWPVYLRRTIRDAVRGRANSTIVRQ
ncbi:hypothetical protein HYY69_01735 [Candidatus Woesearchaeota archaeon]|nr:hypothetical protein [Candidatus Woesearchaeota archaeon]